MAKQLRLDAYLSSAGIMTRREAKRTVRRGKVTVDGEVIRDAGALVSDSAVIIYNNSRVELPPSELHLVLHKPPGYACSRTSREAPLIFELLPAKWQSVVEPAGRLDRATSGLLILSTDGGLIHRLIAPNKQIPKRYRIHYRGPLVADAAERCAAGITLDDDPKPTRPAKLDIHTRPDSKNDMPGTATMTIHEGRYHQVRRMMAALGGEVMHLHRDQIGALELPDDLASGEWREIQAQDLAAAQTAQSITTPCIDGEPPVES